MLNHKFRKIITILVLVLFINFTFNSVSYSYTISNKLLQNLFALTPLNPGSVIGIGLGFATGFAYMYYRNVTADYKQPTPDEIPTDDLIRNTAPSQIAYNGQIYQKSSYINISGTCYSGYKYYYGENISCDEENVTHSIVLTDEIHVFVNKDDGSNNKYWFQGNIYNLTSTPAEVESVSSNVPFTKIQDTPDQDTTVLPIVLDTTKSISENVDLIKQQLSDAGYSSNVVDSVDYDSVADIVSDIPLSIRQDMPLSSVEQELIDRIAENKVSTNTSISSQTLPLNEAKDAVQVEVKDVPDVPTIPDVAIPDIPIFDTNLDIPEQVDFLSPVKNFFNNVLNSIPFVSLLSTANIEISDTQNVISFSYKNHTFTYDLNNHINTFNFMATVIVFCASILAVFILVV